MEIKYEIVWLERNQLDGGICDYCGSRLDEFPCAVLTLEKEDPHALCMLCRVKSSISLGDNEYFETLAFQEKREPPMPGKNFGGRRTGG